MNRSLTFGLLILFSSQVFASWESDLVGSYKTQGTFEGADCQLEVLKVSTTGVFIWKKVKHLVVRTPHFNNNKKTKVSCTYLEFRAGCFVDIDSKSLVLHNPYMGYGSSIWSYRILEDGEVDFECKALIKK